MDVVITVITVKYARHWTPLGVPERKTCIGKQHAFTSDSEMMRCLRRKLHIRWLIIRCDEPESKKTIVVFIRTVSLVQGISPETKSLDLNMLFS
jgi:hypothetical protein